MGARSRRVYGLKDGVSLKQVDHQLSLLGHICDQHPDEDGQQALSREHEHQYTEPDEPPTHEVAEKARRGRLFLEVVVGEPR